MRINLQIIGWVLILLGIIHLLFPKYFKWRSEMNSISLINRQIMYVHTLFIGLMIFLMGILCLIGSKELIETRFGNIISLGFFIFWGVRLLVQFFGYSSKLWKGKPFETFIHWTFAVLFSYLTTVFFIIFYNGREN